MDRLLTVLLLLLSATASTATGDAAKDPYVVTIDLRPWIERLSSDDLFQTDPAIEKLVALNDDAIPALQAALATEDRQTRVNIVEILHDIRTPATVEPLIVAAADQDDEVRTDAVAALGRLGDPRAQAALEAALLGDSIGPARAAAAACRALCTSPAALRRLVEMSMNETTAAMARPSLRATLDGKQRARAVALIEEIALPVMNESSDERRYQAAIILADAGDPKAVPILRQCVSRPIDPTTLPLSMLCVQALGSSSSEDAIAPLVALARSEDRVLRPTACAALGGFVRTSDEARAAYAACTHEQAPAAPGQP